MALRAVIFDLDDTLVAEEATARASLRQSARLVSGGVGDAADEVVLAAIRPLWRAGPAYDLTRELGIASWEGLWSRISGCHPRLDGLRAWVPAYREEAWQAAVAALGGDDPGLAPRLADAYERAQRAGHPLLDGAADAVRATAARYRLGLLTNGPADIQRLKLDQSGLADCFGTVVVSGQAGIGKPAPEAFRMVLDGLGVAAGEAVMVGDSWERDVRGALAAGITPVWVGGSRPAPEADLPVTVVRSVGELPLALAGADLLR